MVDNSSVVTTANVCEILYWFHFVLIDKNTQVMFTCQHVFCFLGADDEFQPLGLYLLTDSIKCYVEVMSISRNSQASRLESNVSMYRIRQLRKSSGESNITLCQKETFEDRPRVVISKENMVSGCYSYLR